MLPPFTIFSLGDGALTVDFGNRIDEGINQTVLRLFQRLKNFSPFISDVVPAYSSVTIYYDVLSLHTKNRTAFETMRELITSVLAENGFSEPVQRREISIPVCYLGSFAPDLNELAEAKQLSVEEVIRLHTAQPYRVYMIGFLPGFAYMGKVDDRITFPRKAKPRTEVPAGAVGIAGEQTGIYPLNSPGGWNIVGRTPLKMFDPAGGDPVLLRPGDEVRFYSITEDEFNHYPPGNT